MLSTADSPDHPRQLTANTMISETLHPIKKAAALTRALAVASNKMNTMIVLEDTLARRPKQRYGESPEAHEGVPVSGPLMPYWGLDSCLAGGLLKHEHRRVFLYVGC